MAPFFFNTFLSLSVFRVGQPKDSSHNPAPGKGDTQWCQAAWVGVGLVGRGQGGRMSLRPAFGVDFPRKVVSRKSQPRTRQPAGSCPNPMQRASRGPRRGAWPWSVGSWGRAGTQSLSGARLTAGTHLGPGRGRQPHSSHVGASDGLDLLQVLVKVLVHELCLKHKTVKRYITF